MLLSDIKCHFTIAVVVKAVAKKVTGWQCNTFPCLDAVTLFLFIFKKTVLRLTHYKTHSRTTNPMLLVSITRFPR